MHNSEDQIVKTIPKKSVILSEHKENKYGIKNYLLPKNNIHIFFFIPNSQNVDI